MWQVHLANTPQPRPTPTHQSANNLMEKRTKYDLEQWYHATLFSPIKQTLIQEINKFYFATWPNLTIDLMNRHLPPSMATANGHMHQTRNKTKSTKQQELMKLEETLMKLLAQRTNTLFTNIINP